MKEKQLVTTAENLEIYMNTSKTTNLLLHEKSICYINPLFEQFLNV